MDIIQRQDIAAEEQHIADERQHILTEEHHCGLSLRIIHFG